MVSVFILIKGRTLILPEENFSPQIANIRDKIQKWQRLKAYKVPDKGIATITGLSRASYYRHKKSIILYGVKGLEKRSKCPKKLRTSKIPLAVTELVLKLRLANPTYGKAKITVLLRRDHAISLSESTVGRIIKNLMVKGKIKRSISCC